MVVTAFSPWERGSRRLRSTHSHRVGSSWPREPGSGSICSRPEVSLGPAQGAPRLRRRYDGGGTPAAGGALPFRAAGRGALLEPAPASAPPADPNIGNRIEAGELAVILSDALPPPARPALEMAAERFDTLDQVREQLAGTQKTSAALSRFLETYRGMPAACCGPGPSVVAADDHRPG